MKDSIFSLEKIDFSSMDSTAINEALAKLQAQAREAKAQIRAAEKAAKEKAKEAAKEARRRDGGQIEKLATILAGIPREAPLTKQEILGLYLKALGLSEEDEASLKKEATLSAQLGARIAPKLATHGCKMGSVREDRKLRYYCYPIEG